MVQISVEAALPSIRGSVYTRNHTWRITMVAREKTQWLIHKIKTGSILWMGRVYFSLATGVIRQVWSRLTTTTTTMWRWWQQQSRRGPVGWLSAARPINTNAFESKLNLHFSCLFDDGMWWQKLSEMLSNSHRKFWLESKTQISFIQPKSKDLQNNNSQS